MQQQSKNANSIYNIPDANILNDLKQLEMEEKRDAASILAITATIASLGFLIITISSRYPAAVINTDILKLYVFDASLYKPESNEHVTYFVSALILPFFCGIYYFVSTRLLSFIEERLFIFYQIVSFFLVGSLLALFLRGLTHYNYIPPSSMYNAPVLNLLVNVIMFGWIIVSSRLSKQIIKRMNIALNYVYMFVSVFIIVVVSVGRVFNETEPYVYGFHFTAYFDSVVQVYLGKTLLVNNSAQYGLYALFLKPLFVLFGLSVFKFTLVMCIIEAMWLLCLLFLMRSTIKNQWIAFAGFMSLVFFLRFRIPIDLGVDPYFQYAPHRMIFPSLFLYLIWLYLSQENLRTKSIISLLISFSCILGVLWGPDSGIIMSITWTIYLIYSEAILLRELALKRVLINITNQLFIFGSVSLFTILCLYLYTYITSGQWPNMLTLFDHARLFGFQGFFLLPIEHIVHPWNMLVVIYITGIFLGVRYFLEAAGIIKSSKPNNSDNQKMVVFILILSLLGIGLFGYYVGRSHDLNLIGPSYPAILLMVIYCDKFFASSYGLFSRLSNINLTASHIRSYYRVVIFAGIFYLITSSVISIIMYFPVHKVLISRRISGVLKGMPESLTQQIQFINQHTKPGDSVFILSDFAPVLYLYSNHKRAIDVPGFAYDLIFQSDMEKVRNFLRSPPENAKVFYSSSFSNSTLMPDKFGDNLVHVVSSKDSSLSLFSTSLHNLSTSSPSR